MQSGGMNPIVKGAIYSVLYVALFAAIKYLTQVIIRGETFAPDWPTTIGLAIFTAILTVAGPDAAQRKRNRQALKDKLTGKN